MPPLKPTGLANSRPQSRNPETRQDKKSLHFEVHEKVDGLFHDRSSFKCTLWNGLHRSAPFSALKTENERENERGVQDGKRPCQPSWSLEAFPQGVRLWGLLWVSWFMLPNKQHSGKSKHLCCIRWSENLWRSRKRQKKSWTLGRVLEVCWQLEKPLQQNLDDSEMSSVCL